MTRKLFIHIGTHKTGTTSIQAFLRNNSKILCDHGLYIPETATIGPTSGHHNLAWQLRSDPRFNPQNGDTDTLLRELKKTTCSKAIISSEDFEYLIQYPAAIINFENKLKAIGWNAEYIVFFRRQDHYAESLYAQLIPYGLTLSYEAFVNKLLEDGSFTIKSDWFFNFDYDNFIKQWEAVVGRRVKVESFDGATATSGIILTLLHATGISTKWVKEHKSDRLNIRRNKSTSPEQTILATKIRQRFHESNINLQNKLDITECDLSALVDATNIQHQTELPLEQKLDETVAQALQQAVNHHNAGQYKAAEELYHGILEIQPEHPDVNYNLGLLAVQTQQANAGLPYFQTAVAVNPTCKQYWSSYISALIHTKQFTAAAQALELGRQHGFKGTEANKIEELLNDHQQAGGQVPTDQPDLVSTNKKTIHTPTKSKSKKKTEAPSRQDIKKMDRLRRKGRPTAIEAFARTLTVRYPNHSLGWKTLGFILHKRGMIDEALHATQKAVQCLPDEAKTHNDLGLLLYKKVQFAQAEFHFKKALEMQPDLAIAMTNWANQLRDQGKFVKSEELYRKAIAIEPNAVLYNNLANSLVDQNKLLEPETFYRRALKINPKFAMANLNLGVCLRKQGRLTEAIKYQRRAVQLDPQNTDQLSNLLFTLNYSTMSSDSFLKEAQQLGRLIEQKVKEQHSSWACTATPDRLRVGFVSGDFHNHPVGFFLESVLDNFASTDIELIAYPTNPKTDELTSRIKSKFLAWKPLYGKDDEVAAQQIHDDGVHLLIDLSGHTTHNRLPMFAWKPAPVQASWLGYFATTGLATMDYFLADDTGVPESNKKDFVETICYLPDTRLCFSEPGIDIAISPLPSLTNKYTTFGSFQQLTKIGEETLKVWGIILNSLPDTRIRLQCKQFDDPKVIEQFFARLKDHGINPSRVTVHGQTSREKYLAAHSEIDLILDTFPYPGGTTTCEALWMGVPTLTLAGNSLLSRQGASLLTAAGLEDWVATNEEDYVKKAIAFVNDPEKLSELRMNLRTQVVNSPLFDARLFVKNFRNALWKMWHEKMPPKELLGSSTPIKITKETSSEEKQVMNFFSPVFWGTKDPERFINIMREASQLTSAYHFGDNMFLFQRNNSMLNDQPFMNSWESNVLTGPDRTIIWRRYILAMAGFHCQHLEGDFVECGAYQGVGAKTVIDYLGGKEFQKTFWLYDLFEHTKDSVNHPMQAHGPKLHEQVVKRFKDYPNVKIFKGFLPDVLDEGCPEKIAYLHLDLNQAPAEIATLEALFDRVVAGGMIILDDYEMVFYRAQKLAEDTWFEERGYKVFPLPTSQGFVIKR